MRIDRRPKGPTLKAASQQTGRGVLSQAPARPHELSGLQARWPDARGIARTGEGKRKCLSAGRTPALAASSAIWGRIRAAGYGLRCTAMDC